jgi:hypothetical protein
MMIIIILFFLSQTCGIILNNRYYHSWHRYNLFEKPNHIASLFNEFALFVLYLNLLITIITVQTEAARYRTRLASMCPV